MPTEEQAGTANEKSPEVTQSQAAVTTALDAVEQEQDRIADLEARLTQKGRKERALENEIKEAKASVAQLREEYEKAVEANKQWQEVYYNRFAPESDRARYAQQKAAEAKAASAGSVNEAATWRAIAEESNPMIREALTKMAKADKYLSTAQIKAMSEVLGSTKVETKDEEDQKPLAKVGATNTTGGGKATLQQQLAAAIKDGNAEEILAVKSQIALSDFRANRA
jgi:hypothetical protein